ncbi:MAG: ABC transporter ATP-binding protein/permease [Thermomicrobiales bacterium]|nr:ABC transporter ATP-binding protein/permease [Thermomicrobiales bacterium]
MKILVRILGYLKPYWVQLIGVYAALFIGMGFQLLIPLLLARAIDNGVIDRDLGYLTRMTIFIVVAAALQAVFTYIRSYGTNALAERVGNDIRDQLYDTLQAQPFSFYDRAQSGQLMSRATEDINNIRGMLMFALRAIVQTIGLVIVIAIIVLREDWLLGLVALSTVPIMLLWSTRFSITIRPMFLQVQQQFGVMTSALQENVAGGRVVRAFAQEQAESDRFEEELDELFERNMRAAKRFSFSFPMQMGVNGLSVAGVIWVGAWMVLNGRISLGTLVAFERYTSMLQDPVRMLGFVVNRIARAIASGERIFELLDTVPAIQNASDAKTIEMHGIVQFHDVSFRYRKRGAEALHDVDFEAHPDQITALVGPTGSGKSSVIGLIPRFYDVQAGSVTIDGHDVRELELDSLRHQIGIVMQDSFLFSMTIRENIAYGDPNASFEQVVAAAKAAQAHDFILQQDEGYDTVIGERGVTLSGGQKQRLSIARALLIDPRILILDDSTASVDSETEHEIQLAMRTLMKGRTSIVIAQRLSTVRDADQILVFEHGEITQRGTHDSLITETDGFYAELWALQQQDAADLVVDVSVEEEVR